MQEKKSPASGEVDQAVPPRGAVQKSQGGAGVLGAVRGDDVPFRLPAVLHPAAVRQDGAAGARRLLVGVGRGAAVLPGRAARRLRLRASADALCAAGVDRLRASRASRCWRSSCCPSDCRRPGASRRRAIPISGSSACSPWPSGCRSSPSPPTRRCCRRGSRARAIRTRRIPTSSTAPPTSAASSPCSAIRSCFEPAFGLTALSRYWAMLYVVLIVAIGACFALVRRRARRQRRDRRQRPSTPDAGAPTWRQRIAWCGLALVPAALLTAFTTHIATDIASAPLLWVLPLAIYLLTFVLAFQSRLPLPMWLLLPAQLAAVIFALLELAQTKHDKWVLTSGAGVAAFFLAALVAHRTLYLDAPAAPAISPSSICGCRSAACSAGCSRRSSRRAFSPRCSSIRCSSRCRSPAAPACSTSPDRPRRDCIWIFGIFAAGLLVDLAGAAARRPLRLHVRRLGHDAGHRAGLRRRRRRVLEPRRAPAHRRADDVRRRRHAAVRGQARPGAAQLLRRLSRQPVRRRRLQCPDARHDAARRAAPARPHRQHRLRRDARNLLLPRRPRWPPP